MTVTFAKPYSPGLLGPDSIAQNILLRQFQFPHRFHDYEGHLVGDTFHFLERNRAHFERCAEKHLRPDSQVRFEDRIRELPDETVLQFLRDLFRVDHLPRMKVDWNGYRILGSVNPAGGALIFTFELFAKDPASDTRVYTGEHAPNVQTHEWH